MIAALSLGLCRRDRLGVVGGGGSIIAVPALVYGVGMSPSEAIPTSLLVVGVSSLAALLPRLRDRHELAGGPDCRCRGHPGRVGRGRRRPAAGSRTS